MIVEKPVQFNQFLVKTRATVINTLGDSYLVDFTYEGVKFSGYWKINDCTVVQP